MPRMTALRKGRLVRVELTRPGRLSKVYQLGAPLTAAHGERFFQLLAADHLHEDGSARSRWGHTREDHLTLLQRSEGQI